MIIAAEAPVGKTHWKIGKNIKSRGEKPNNILQKCTGLAHNFLRGPVIDSWERRGHGKNKTNKQKVHSSQSEGRLDKPAS